MGSIDFDVKERETLYQKKDVAAAVVAACRCFQLPGPTV